MNDKNALDIYNNDHSYDENLFWEYVNEIKEKNDEYYKKTGKRKKHLTVTYGCQMNEHDSEKMSWILDIMGYQPASDLEDTDIVIYNTCAIRENAELKVYGKIGSLKRLKEEKPDLQIAICGCMMQIESIRNTIKTKYRHVDIIFGTNNIHKLPKFISDSLATDKTIIDVEESTHEVIENIYANRTYTYKSYVNIMYGCNNFCTYCIVPYTRGREISREPKNILDEIRGLAAKGYKEITLLGQNVNSYGKTLKEKYTFTNLLEDIDKIPGIERIRFMTSHPRDISDELIEAYGKLDHLCNHLHLPVQSGSNRILKNMNRHYTREAYLEKIKRIKEVQPNIALSTDIIVGFPGETEEDFQDTLSLMREVEYDSAYIFIYSIREGTKAATMENQVDDKVKHRRLTDLSDVLNEIALKKNQKLIGETLEVLVEDLSKTNDEFLSGRSPEFKIVHFKGDKSLIGKIVKVKINTVKTFSLEGEIID